MVRLIIIILAFGLYCLGFMAAAQDPSTYSYTVENMRDLNSRYSDISLIPCSDSTFFLVSNREGKEKYNSWVGGTPYDMYVVDRDDPSAITLPAGLKTKFSDGPAAFISPRELLITQTNNRGQVDDVSKVFVYRLNISNAVYRDGSWVVEEIKQFKSKLVSHAHPALSPDGSVMVFSSDMEGGFGGKDLYVCYGRGTNWSEPVNLGATINSKKDEMFPFIHADGKLYFSSNRKGGIGGFDNYVAPVNEAAWGDAMLLPAPLNSTANEYAIYFDAAMQEGYFSSNRLGGKGGDDIYKIHVEQHVPELISALDTQETEPEQQPADDSTEEFNLEPVKTKVEGEVLSDGVANAKTVKSVTLLKTTEGSTAGMDGGFYQLDARDQLVFIEHQMMENDLSNIYFERGDHTIDEHAATILEKLADMLEKYETAILEIHAHADAVGDFQQNVKLTEKRARSVMQYLISGGIPTERMRYRAYGESDLYIHDPDDLRLNRRVEFKLELYEPPSLTGKTTEASGTIRKELGMIEGDMYYVQIGAVAASALFDSYTVREFGPPICYFEHGLYKYVHGPFATKSAALKHKQAISENHPDAFIFRNYRPSPSQ